MKQNKQYQYKNGNLKNDKNREYPYTSWFFLLLIIAFVAYVRIRLLSTPLERDEGEYAYMGQLLLQGVPPFQEAFNMKLPGTSAMYALFMFLFGETISAIHLGLLIVNVASIILLFIITRRGFSAGAGVVTAASFAMITLNPALLGFAAHASHFVVGFALAAILMLIISCEKKKNLWVFTSGVLFGCAFLMKQPGIFFFFFGISYVFIYRISSTVTQKELFRFVLLICLGLIVPVALLLAVILSSGTFHRFWFWVVEYASAYGSIVKFDEGWYNLKYTSQLIWNHLALICICTGVGLFFTIRGRLQKNTNWILFLFACFSLLALLPGWYFRHHYFVFIAPLCSMFIGVGFYVFQKTEPKWKYLPLLLFGTVLCENILSHEHYYFITSPTNVVKETYYGKFPESIEIGNFLASHTKPSDRIAVLGSEPQIFFYSKRRSVSGYIYMYSLVELQPYARRMQDELIADIEQKKPGYIVLYKISHSWSAKAGSDLHIIDWSTKYIDTYYSVAGIVEIIDVYNVRYMWGLDAQKYTPLSQEVIYIYKRNIDHHEP